MESRVVHFHVQANQCQHNEEVFVVGQCDELGNWLPYKAVPLQQQSQNVSLWSGSVTIPTNLSSLEYRYFIGSRHTPEVDQPDIPVEVLVRLWETALKPRTIRLEGAQENGVQADSSDVFGTYGGQTKIDKGWLTKQTEIHLRLHSNPVVTWKPLKPNEQYSIRCDLTDISGEELDDEEIYSHSPYLQQKVLVSVLNGYQCVPSEQPPRGGTIFQKNDYMVFRTQTITPQNVGFHFEINILTKPLTEDDSNSSQLTTNSNNCRLLGNAFVLPLNMKDNIGKRSVPIIGSKHKPVGELTVDFLMIRPLPVFLNDMHVTYAKHWKYNRLPLDVGHRGMGNSFCMQNCATVRENTIESLEQAGAHGADYVEFDVQLSKDRVPVIYHDFKVCLSLARKSGTEELEWFEIPVQTLDLAQLQMLQLGHRSEKSKGRPSKDSHSDDPIDHRPFPTLVECLERIDSHVGFNVEIKYCMQLMSGDLEEEMTEYMERNKYLDIILGHLMPNVGDRRIIFSSFDPDICTMLQLKQNRYPVLFLSIGQTTKWPPYLDWRTDSTLKGIHLACCEGFLGVNPHTEDLLKDQSLIDEAKARGLVLFCWGDDNNQPDNIQLLKEKGVDGVIYDRIYEHKGRKDNIFKLEKKAKMQILRNAGMLENDVVLANGTSSNGLSTSSTMRNDVAPSINDHVNNGHST